MGNGELPACRPAFDKAITLVAVFVFGLGAGVGLDRLLLNAGAWPISPRQGLLGAWAASDGVLYEFLDDGTFTETSHAPVVVNVKSKDASDQPKRRMVDKEGRLTGQYRWAGTDDIEVKIQGEPARIVKVVIGENGQKLSLLEADGRVSRLYRRDK